MTQVSKNVYENRVCYDMITICKNPLVAARRFSKYTGRNDIYENAKAGEFPWDAGLGEHDGWTIEVIDENRYYLAANTWN